LDRGAPDGQVASINLPSISEELDYAIAEDAYGLMATESPAPPESPSRCPSHSVMKGHICRIQCSGLPSVLCRLLCGAGLPIKRQYVTVRINCVGSAKKMVLYPRTGLNGPNR